MTLLRVLTLATVAVLTFPSSGQESIRVRTFKGLKKVEVSGVGLKVGLSPAVLTTVDLSLRRVQIELLSTSNRWPIWRVKYAHEKQSRRLIGERLYVEGEWLQMAERAAPHTLELTAVAASRIDVIAPLDLEKYLTGVLPSEMPAHWPVEALKAQAVASRSYAVALAYERRHQDFDVESSVLDQVFDLTNKVGASARLQAKVAQVVRATAGQVILNAKGQVIKAHYHADCGGQTEWARNVWGDLGPETGVAQDALCPLSPWAHWRYKMTRQELRQAVEATFALAPHVGLMSLAIVGRTPSGRVAQVDLVFSDHQRRRVSAHEFRRMVGFTKLKSTNFQFHWNGNQVTISGRGHGHGVGLCQHGTRALAERGVEYRQILHNYYPLTKIGKLRSLDPNSRVRSTQFL